VPVKNSSGPLSVGCDAIDLISIWVSFFTAPVSIQDGARAVKCPPNAIKMNAPKHFYCLIRIRSFQFNASTSERTNR
jgi:hypothetical protein